MIVDSPGIGESRLMTQIVKDYFPTAFAFIYVINSANAGGLQPDRVGTTRVIGLQGFCWCDTSRVAIP